MALGWVSNTLEDKKSPSEMRALIVETEVNYLGKN